MFDSLPTTLPLTDALAPAQPVLTLGFVSFAGVMFVLFFAACFLLMLTVLIQKPQGGGLAGAFGSGAGSGQTAFGTRTGDALTWATIGMFVLYLGTAIGLNLASRPESLTPRPTTAESAPATTTTGEKPAGNVTVEPVTPAQPTTPPVTPPANTPATPSASTPPAAATTPSAPASATPATPVAPNVTPPAPATNPAPTSTP